MWGTLYPSWARRYWIGYIVMYGAQWINLFALCSCGLKSSPLLWDDILPAEEHSRFVLTMTDNGLRKVCFWTWSNSLSHLLRHLKIYWIKNKKMPFRENHCLYAYIICLLKILPPVKSRTNAVPEGEWEIVSKHTKMSWQPWCKVNEEPGVCPVTLAVGTHRSLRFTCTSYLSSGKLDTVF